MEQKCCSGKKMVFLSTIMLAVLYSVTFVLIVMHNESSKEFSVADNKLVDHSTGEVLSSRCLEALCENPFSEEHTSDVNWLSFWNKDGLTRTQVIGMHKVGCQEPEADSTCVAGFHHVYNTNNGYFLAVPAGRAAVFQPLESTEAHAMITPKRDLLAAAVIRTVASGVVME